MDIKHASELVNEWLKQQRAKQTTDQDRARCDELIALINKNKEVNRGR